MAKRSQIDQLNDAMDAIIAHPDSTFPPVESSLQPLIQLVRQLRSLPSEEFKTRLRAELMERRTSMTATQTIEVSQHLTLNLSVRNAAAAIEFYKNAFGAKELYRLDQPDGRIGHAEIQIGEVQIMLADEFPEYGFLSPQSIGGTPINIHLYVDNVDAVLEQAVSAGAQLLSAAQDQFYGERSGQITDPFGYRWVLCTPIEAITTDEVKSRFENLIEEESKTSVVFPEGFHTVTPYLIVNEAAELIDFVKEVFSGEEKVRSIGSQGGIHCELRVGNSMLMVGGGEAWRGTPAPAEIHIYVKDADATYDAALRSGASSIYGPTDQPYGDREAGVVDRAGNRWYIGTHRKENYIPEGLRTITPTLHPKGAPQLIDFMKKGLGATEVERHAAPDGSVLHAKISIGDSVIEMGEAHGQFQHMPTTFYLYMENVDAAYTRAMLAGATSISAPADQPYGDRVAGVTDFAGNVWYFATPLRK